MTKRHTGYMSFWRKRGLPRSTSGTRTAANIMELGYGPTPEYNEALDQLEPGEFVALVTSAGLTKQGNTICPMGRVFLTNRRVLFIFDTSMATFSMDLLNREIRLFDPGPHPNHVILLDHKYGVVVPKQESAMFLALAEKFSRDFDRPADWYSDPGDPKQLRYWSGSSWTDHVHPAES